MDERASLLAKTLMHYGLVATIGEANQIAQQIMEHKPVEKLPTIDELDSVEERQAPEFAMENKTLLELMQEDAEEIYSKSKKED